MSFIIFTNKKECIILISFVNIVLSSPDLVFLNAILHIPVLYIFIFSLLKKIKIKVNINGCIAQVKILT